MAEDSVNIGEEDNNGKSKKVSWVCGWENEE